MSTSSRRVGSGAVALGLLVAAVLLAAVVSLVASGSPDGLERVAEDQGFAESEQDHATGDGPFADYRGPAAGVVGVVAVLALTGGLVAVLRRRRPTGDREG